MGDGERGRRERRGWNTYNSKDSKIMYICTCMRMHACMCIHDCIDLPISLILVKDVSLFTTCSSDVLNPNTPECGPSMTGERRGFGLQQTGSPLRSNMVLHCSTHIWSLTDTASFS